jgi:deazaflavin-dependent oxidoreductase (nitroreductase family)
MRTCIRRMFSAIVFAVSIAFFAQVMLGIDSRFRRDLVRGFNKHVLNPLALWVVARRRMYYGVLHHIGRRSGATYATPVVAKLTSGGVVIPLPYGADTDWCRNVLAAGGCTLTFGSKDYTLNSPEIVPASVAEALVPSRNAAVWRRFGIDTYLLLKVAVAGSSHVAEAAAVGAAA